MQTSVLRAVAAALDAPEAPHPDEHVLVGTSGGPDSTALLHALATLAPSRGLRITAGHVDHGLRGEESRADAAAVAALADRLGVPCRIAVVPVSPGADLENRAREARHRALRRMAREAGATRIALAHTEDDQVETVLLRLLRGAGRRGLGGMAPQRGRLWRPLLGATRADVRRHLAEAALPFRVDRTNADLHHARNRLRRLVVPLLAREFNPRVGAAVAALAARLRDEDAFLDGVAAAGLTALRRADGLAVAVGAEHPAIARRIVRAWLAAVVGGTVPAREIDRILALARGGRGNVAVPGPGRVLREGDVLVHRAGRQGPTTGLDRPLAVGSVLEGPEGSWRLAVSAPRARVDDDLAGLSVRRARFDADLLALPLAIRSVEPGDRIAVPGVGTRKLQDVFVDAKIPRERRRTVPVVIDASGAIVWVPGIARGDRARLGPSTTRVVEMRFE